MAWLFQRDNVASYIINTMIGFHLLFLVGMPLMAINPIAEDELDLSSVRGSKKSLQVDWTYEEQEPSEPSEIDRASSRASSMAPILVVNSPDPDVEGVTIDLECNL
jgi:hypothetical protein